MELPASLGSGKCFKPEAHLLIEKFLSLKKENSRDLFIANAVDLTSDRRKVSYFFIFSKFGGTPTNAFFFNAQSFLLARC